MKMKHKNHVLSLRKGGHKTGILSFFLLCGSFLGILFLGNVKEHSTRPLYLTPPAFLQHFSLGYKDFWADLLWLRLLQSADFCSFSKGRPIYRGDIKQCELGWSYRVADLITDLAPRFKAPYLFSPVMLSVFTGDRTGAERLLKKGLMQFPKDWRLLFYGTYFYSMEVKLWNRASRYARQSALNGGPQWLYDFSPATVTKVSKTLQQDLLKRKLTEKQKKYVQKKWRSAPPIHR